MSPLGVFDGTVTLITAPESPQAPGPTQFATVSFSVPPVTDIDRLATSPQDALFSTFDQLPPRSYL